MVSAPCPDPAPAVLPKAPALLPPTCKDVHTSSSCPAPTVPLPALATPKQHLLGHPLDIQAEGAPVAAPLRALGHTVLGAVVYG